MITLTYLLIVGILAIAIMGIVFEILGLALKLIIAMCAVYLAYRVVAWLFKF